MQITHEKARELIQFDADQALNAEQKAILATHLRHCTECLTYAEEMREVEHLLLPAMRKHWHLQPIPLSIDALVTKRNAKIQASMLLTMRTAAISLALFAFFFSAWQFMVLGQQGSSLLPASVLPIPTPSTQSTSTQTLFQSCAEISYIVQENDTLESIAAQFSIAKEEIMAMNNMETEIVQPSMELMIPICGFTPTITAHPFTLTTTYAPAISPTTSTPGNRY
jgi:hypothetical protein